MPEPGQLPRVAGPWNRLWSLPPPLFFLLLTLPPPFLPPFPTNTFTFLFLTFSSLLLSMALSFVSPPLFHHIYPFKWTYSNLPNCIKIIKSVFGWENLKFWEILNSKNFKYFNWNSFIFKIVFGLKKIKIVRIKENEGKEKRKYGWCASKENTDAA